MNVELLLSDEFVSFSNNIANIHAAKKQEESDFKEKYAAFKLSMQEYDNNAAQLQKEWEEFAATKTNKKKGKDNE